jgi:ribose transport system permease protein
MSASTPGKMIAAPPRPARIAHAWGPDVLHALYRLAAVVLLSVALAFLSKAFLSWGNILNVLRQASLLFLIASGLTLVILTAGLDLSVGANLGFSAGLAAAVIKMTGSAVIGSLTALGCGAAIGLGNGILVALLGIPPFIATYGMLWVCDGFTYYFMGGGAIYGFPSGFRALGTGHLFGIPVPIYVMVAFLAAGTVITRRTTFGQDIFAIGANAVAARLSGIPLRRRLIAVYATSGAMAGLAAIVYLARVNSAEAGIGGPLLLPAIAAVLIGGTSLFGGIGSLFGTMVGALLLTLVLNGMNLLSIDAKWQPFVTGAIVLIALLIDLATRRYSERAS